MGDRWLWRLIASVLVCQLAGVLGSLFTTPNIPGWYEQLLKPAYTPPDWVFAPVWTLLYALMGLALFVVWGKGRHVAGVRAGLWLFAVQLLLNVGWSALFFGLRSPVSGFACIAVLLLAIVATTALFWRVSAVAGVLMLPYLGWTTFAAALNYGLMVLNPS
jgi:benzodiazapine receptor